MRKSIAERALSRRGARNKIQRRRNYSMGLKEQIEKLNPYLRDSSYIKQNA